MSATPSRDRRTNLLASARALEGIFGEKELTVWRVAGERFMLVYSAVVPVSPKRATARRLWRQHAAELRAGQVVRTDGCALIPLIDRELVGFVQVVGEPATVATDIVPLVRGALTTLTAVLLERDVLPVEIEAIAQGTRPAGLDEALVARAEAEVDAAAHRLREARRRKLLGALEENGWNAAATARELRFGRTKLYKVMRTLGVKRPKPAPTDPRCKRPRDSDDDTAS